jgi:hypothetical protein
VRSKEKQITNGNREAGSLSSIVRSRKRTREGNTLFSKFSLHSTGDVKSALVGEPYVSTCYHNDLKSRVVISEHSFVNAYTMLARVPVRFPATVALHPPHTYTHTHTRAKEKMKKVNVTKLRRNGAV